MAASIGSAVNMLYMAELQSNANSLNGIRIGHDVLTGLEVMGNALRGRPVSVELGIIKFVDSKTFATVR